MKAGTVLALDSSKAGKELSMRHTQVQSSSMPQDVESCNGRPFVIFTFLFLKDVLKRIDSCICSLSYFEYGYLRRLTYLY